MPLEADVTAKLTGLFREWKGIDPERLEPLPPTASNRTYVRLHTNNSVLLDAGMKTSLKTSRLYTSAITF
jgi:hypothetical protein